MLENLSGRLAGVVKTLRGQARITEANVQDTLRQVRLALLEADVALPVVKRFIESVKVRALGQEVLASLTPGQALIGIVHEELTRLMGGDNADLDLAATPPAVILMAGLQGSGKTTTSGKLALLLKNRKKKVLLASADVYRPAAIDQLRQLGRQLDVAFFEAGDERDPLKIARAAQDYARRQFFDVLIVDTAGRLAIDEAMMNEIKALHAAIAPVETLFVVDAMQGQDAVNVARAFNEALPLTGVVLTKLDGDARGGAALSVREITGKPLKFIGVGEKPNGLEPFHPERMAQRILGMGDVLSLIEQAQGAVDIAEAKKLADKVKKGKDFDLEDFKAQIQQMRKMGGLSALMDKLPGAANMALPAGADEKAINRVEGIINSMTPQERRKPEIIKASRKRRIAAGAGVQVQDVNKLLNQFEQAQKMMKMMGKGGLGKMMRGMKGMLPGMR
ncbi:signal recognition particle protein [Betaproteobacteria bacterium SCN1]|jgi:signal recognition particle subunit SRP54|nr:signal recognition particle protein [Betaproteobacteria bacterium SCN1]MBN8759162.1 signal recognition particle protein [Thiobacillus sp.]ODU91234.1 MAG: signal recognition particle protein [Thiobacillus sp. SCN 65-179]OJW38136.1 MAG: signal recognition particle protein [Thiobacillus sp. 65-69]